MKRFSRFIMFSLAIMGFSAVADMRQGTYNVSEIVRVLTPVSFECRLVDFPDAPQTRFQVLLKDTQSLSDKKSEAMAELNKLLRSATKIELKNAKVRNYFRLEAEVWVDGKNLSAGLLSANLIQPKEVISEMTAPVDSIAMALAPTPLRPQNKPQPIRREIPKYGLQHLMGTKVDLSSLTSETPLYEALKLISDSLGPHLPMVVFWSDVQNNAFVEKDSPIGVEGFGVISAAQALDSVLYSVSGYGVPLKFTIKDGILKVGTVRTLSQRTTEVYSVLDLVSAPSYDMSESGLGGEGSSSFSGRSR
ncbi:MAG: hypothetical protein LLF76_13465 [Planctomycetaceae bacterium]|nr:hypothetical protein [Planctomycetaceae bacterium]